ncbi:MAG: tyrosine-type recombinase/integrase [Tropicimonas sp.]|uniref:tyrosine-type recombinase/integrase n=1 Tax=Tropicimonas sp. TaxID=2067044 RepID=UPI003A8643BC
MATQEMTFTKGALDKTAHAGGAATRYRDARYPNLYLEVGARSKTWRYRKFWKGQNFTETLGTWPQMTVIEAAQTAAEINTQVEDAGVVTKDARPRGAGEITLREALEQHVTQALDPRQRKISEETAAGYASVMRLHVPRWLDMPISDITRQMVNEKIKAMSNIPTTASSLLRAVSAIYGTQLAYRDDGYEHDPTYRVKGYEARTRELLFDEAKRWPALDAISKVPNLTRRAAWLALLFTGFRMRNIRELKWSDIDFDERMLTLGRMKNGQKRTFPLSDIAVDVFRQTPRTHDVIVFEGRHYNKPITGLRQIDKDGNDVNNGGVLRPHDTRHLFSSAAAKAGLSGPVINWMRGDITIMQGAAGRYMHDLGSHADANAIAEQIVAKCAPETPLAELLTGA